MKYHIALMVLPLYWIMVIGVGNYLANIIDIMAYTNLDMDGQYMANSKRNLSSTKYTHFLAFCIDGDDDSVFHNPCGPALIWDSGETEWWLYDLKHRYYGPQHSLERAWWINGRIIV